MTVSLVLRSPCSFSAEWTCNQADKAHPGEGRASYPAVQLQPRPRPGCGPLPGKMRYKGGEKGRGTLSTCGGKERVTEVPRLPKTVLELTSLGEKLKPSLVNVGF